MAVVVYASRHAPRAKIDAMLAEGADVRLCDGYDQAERRAKEHGRAADVSFISPYAHPDVIAGAGTLGLEILEDWPEVDTIVVPVGGGGLISGVALATGAATRRPSVVGVEAEASSPFRAGLAAGRIVAVDVRHTFADGLAGNLDAETPTFDIVRSHVDRIVQVSEAELGSAIRGVLLHERLVAEGAGAAGAAAILSRRIAAQGRNVAVILSGANIDADVLKDLLSSEEIQLGGA